MSEEVESLKDKIKRLYRIQAYLLQAKEEELELRNEIIEEGFSSVADGKTGKMTIGDLLITCKKGTTLALNVEEYDKATPDVKKWLAAEGIIKSETVTKTTHKVSKPAIGKVTEEMQPWVAPYILEKSSQPTLTFKGIVKKDQ